MKADYILSLFRNDDEIKVAFDVIQNIFEFHEKYEVRSMESVLLILSGHSPIMDYKFSVDKFKSWCNQNNLQVVIDDLQRIAYLKK